MHEGGLGQQSAWVSGSWKELRQRRPVASCEELKSHFLSTDDCGGGAKIREYGFSDLGGKDGDSRETP